MKSCFEFKDYYSIDDLIKIVSLLRSPRGCPWDIEQTHESIKQNLIEEAYETVDAINKNDNTALCEELGDLLLQVVFHSQIETDTDGRFSLNDVADCVSKKLILRHPHVFGEVEAETTQDVLENWDEIKKVEKNQTTYTETLTSVPKVFPSLMRAQKVQKRASKVGFDFDNGIEAIKKIEEEITEASVAVNKGNQSEVKEEIGDLLFSVVNFCRFAKVDAEEALAAATEKFIKRFAEVEQQVISTGRDMKKMSMDELDFIWENQKH